MAGAEPHVEPDGVSANQSRRADPCSDDLLWLPFVTAESVAATGDVAILDVPVPFLTAEPLGRRGFDDGVAMFVLADDHTIDVEVGYGLEARVPDAIASRIIRDVMAPRLRLGDRDGSVTSGVDALLAAIQGQPWAGAVAIPAPETGHSLLTWILGGLAVIAFLILGGTHPPLALLLLWAFSGGRRGGGGFSGGGGRSGGGGARGSW